MKNQTLLMYSGSLVASNAFHSVTQAFAMVGHTHSTLDQRFSILGSALKAAPVLQEPKDFVDLIQNKVAPGRLRELKVFEVGGAWGYKKHFEQLLNSVSGLTPTHWEPDVNHCWRIVRRGDLDSYVKLGKWELSVQLEALQL